MTDNTELKSAIEYILNQGALDREFIENADLLDAAWAVYDALGPTDILVLIADLDEARNGMKYSCAIRLKKRIELLETQRDQLIADNERLTKAVGLQVIRRFVGDDDQKKMDELVSAGIQVDKDRIAQLETERDQLKAENAGLRTGYEAYERVNAELKAEVEKLRKERDARHPFKPFHEPSIGYTGCVICGMYTDHGGLPCPKTRATADAAMGKGEQS